MRASVSLTYLFALLELSLLGLALLLLALALLQERLRDINVVGRRCAPIVISEKTMVD